MWCLWFVGRIFVMCFPVALCGDGESSKSQQMNYADEGRQTGKSRRRRVLQRSCMGSMPTFRRTGFKGWCSRNDEAQSPGSHPHDGWCRIRLAWQTERPIHDKCRGAACTPEHASVCPAGAFTLWNPVNLPRTSTAPGQRSRCVLDGRHAKFIAGLRA